MALICLLAWLSFYEKKKKEVSQQQQQKNQREAKWYVITSWILGMLSAPTMQVEPIFLKTLTGS